MGLLEIMIMIDPEKYHAILNRMRCLAALAGVEIRLFCLTGHFWC